MTRRLWPDWQSITTPVVLAALLLAWEVASRTVLADQYVLAGPLAILARIVDDAGLYGRALAVTLREAALGFLFGNAVAVLLAAIAIAIPALDRMIKGVALVVFCLPLVATGPILRVIYGVGDGPQITLAALAVYYTTLVPLLVGLKAVPPAWTDLVRTYGRGRWIQLIVVRAPAGLPYLIAGLQIAAPAAFLGAMIGQFTGADRGMGVLAIQAIRTLDPVATWALATIATAVSVLAYLAVGWLGRVLTRSAPPLILATTGGGRAVGRWRRIADPVLSLAVTLATVWGLWIGMIRVFDLNPFFAKGPGDVFAFMLGGPAAAANREQLFEALGQTLAVAVPGYVAGLALGAALAVLFDQVPLIRRTMTPIAIALRAVPIIATAPLVVLALGRGDAAMITVIAIMAFFPTLVACAHGLRQVPPQVLEFFAVFDSRRLTVFWQAQLPAMVPALFASGRIAVPTVVLAATVAEWLSTGSGIGNLMVLTYTTSNYNMLWSCIVLLTLVSAVGYALVGLVERIALMRFAPEQVTA